MYNKAKILYSNDYGVTGEDIEYLKNIEFLSLEQEMHIIKKIRLEDFDTVL